MREIYKEYLGLFQRYSVSEEAISSFTDLEVEKLGEILIEHYVSSYRTTPKAFMASGNITLFEDISKETREKFVALFEI